MSSAPLWTRDKGDTLLLLGACVLVLLPLATHVPWWAGATSALLLCWRGWLTYRGQRLPPALLLLPLTALAMGGVYLSHRSFLGREAGVTMLVLLLTFKLLEMHARRDLFVVIFLAFFLLLTHFFYSQDIAAAALSLAAVTALLTALLSFQYTGQRPPLRQRVKLAATLLGLALPLTLVIFLLFPRISGPLWGLPDDARGARSGLSNSMSPGAIGELVLSDEIAFRARFSGSAPDQRQLYWRGVVLTQFDGRDWTPGPELAGAEPGGVRAIAHGRPLQQEITLEAHRERWLFALDLPGQVPQLEAGQARLTARMELRSSEPIMQRTRYQAFSFPSYQLQPTLAPGALQQALELPEGRNPRSLAWARQLRQEHADAAARINTVLGFFRREPFSYTLDPPTLGPDSVDDFLFTTRAGFCEHYASAFVVLMRGAGIPARVVTGYQGGSYNTVDGVLTVRQSDAHAWAEVWLPGQGWLRVDPTAAVAPERVEHNLRRALPRRGLGGLLDLTLAQSGWAGQARMLWDAVNHGWNQWVLNYNQASQFNLLRRLGLRDINWEQLVAVFFALTCAVMAVIAWPVLRNRTRLDPLERIYLSFCQTMAHKGVPRALHEGPLAYAQRLHSRLDADAFAHAERFLRLYAALRYGKPAARPEQRLQHLKTLAARCR